MNTTSLWNNPVCQKTDEERLANPDKYKEKDQKTSAMLDRISTYRNENYYNEKNEAENFIKDLNNKIFKETDLTNRQLGILNRVYGQNWKNQLLDKS